MKLDSARSIAQKYMLQLKPYCLKVPKLNAIVNRIKIAGSIRREKDEVKDIEIVCIPDPDKIFEFAQFVDGFKKVKGEPIGKYTQRELPEGIKLDLFMADETNYGLITMIRTGSWEFSKRIMWECITKGFYVKGGYLHNTQTDEIVSVQDEEDFFNICNIKYVEPKQRIN